LRPKGHISFLVGAPLQRTQGTGSNQWFNQFWSYLRRH
jgi:hypothetical protein